jgi:23S rRNA pseudouridine1911/1915/1917 synthase
MKPEIKVLYEDNHLIAVYKPAGTLVQGDSSGERCLMDEVKDFIKKRDKKPGNVFLGLIHRLDRHVSGIVLFSKTSKGASRISEQFREHTVEKIYEAWVEGTLREKRATLKDMIKRDGDEQYAELSYKVIEEEKKENKSLLRVELKTGRHHQIRIQLSRLGHPILGDVSYGAKKSFSDQHIELSAVELRFTKATEDERVIVKL